MHNETHGKYEEEARALHDIGGVFARADLPQIEVRLPRELAERAVKAWQRDSDKPVGDETHEQRASRHRAGTLALIGLSIEERGQWTDDEAIVALDPVLIGLAVDASDEA